MKIIAGNWKMNGDIAALNEMLDALRNVKTENTVIICPPATMLYMAADGGSTGPAPANLFFGAQDCSAHDSGTYTGEVSARMIAETGAKYVITGHSERRKNHAETNEIVAQKAAQALKSGLIPIICVGDTREDRKSGFAKDIVEKQLRESIPALRCASRLTPHDVIIAYEPAWAISTGIVEKTDDVRATTDDIFDMHAHIAGILKSMGLAGTAILYGGSAKGSNASEILTVPHVDGVLVGGASLKPADFLPVVMC